MKTKHKRPFKEEWKPPIPLDRLEAMRIALIRHVYTGEAWHQPLDDDTALEIERTLVLVKLLFEKRTKGRKRSRATRENLHAAAVAKFLIEFSNYGQEDAAVAAFPNPHGAEPASLARTYRNLLPLLHDPYAECRPPGVRVEDLVEAQARFKALNGKLPPR